MKKTTRVYDIDEAGIISELRSMESSSTYLTKPNYRGTSERWTDDYVSFVDYHINYLRTHPTLNPEHYIANLRLVLNKRQLKPNISKPRSN